jgi:hypothetical protein
MRVCFVSFFIVCGLLCFLSGSCSAAPLAGSPGVVLPPALSIGLNRGGVVIVGVKSGRLGSGLGPLDTRVLSLDTEDSQLQRFTKGLTLVEYLGSVQRLRLLKPSSCTSSPDC